MSTEKDGVRSEFAVLAGLNEAVVVPHFPGAALPHWPAHDAQLLLFSCYPLGICNSLGLVSSQTAILDWIPFAIYAVIAVTLQIEARFWLCDWGWHSRQAPSFPL